MEVKFIKNITKEGNRKVINIPKKYSDKLNAGQKMLVSELNYKNLSKEDLMKLIE